MKSILKVLVCMSILLISKLTKEEKVTTSGAAMETIKVESSFINYQPQAKMLHEDDLIKAKEAQMIY